MLEETREIEDKAWMLGETETETKLDEERKQHLLQVAPIGKASSSTWAFQEAKIPMVKVFWTPHHQTSSALFQSRFFRVSYPFAGSGVFAQQRVRRRVAVVSETLEACKTPKPRSFPTTKSTKAPPLSLPKNKRGRTGRSTRRRSKAVEVTDAPKEKEQQKWQDLFCVQLRCGGCHHHHPRCGVRLLLQPPR